MLTCTRKTLKNCKEARIFRFLWSNTMKCYLRRYNKVLIAMPGDKLQCIYNVKKWIQFMNTLVPNLVSWYNECDYLNNNTCQSMSPLSCKRMQSWQFGLLVAWLVPCMDIRAHNRPRWDYCKILMPFVIYF